MYYGSIENLNKHKLIWSEDIQTWRLKQTNW